MKKIFTLSLLCSGLLFLYSCSNDYKNNEDNYADKHKNELINNFRTILTAPQNGWHIEYFPDINSKLNHDVNENYKTSEQAISPVYLTRRIGVGGFNMFVKFENNGKVRMITDIPYKQVDQATSHNPVFEPNIQTAYYDISIADDMNLYFTTNTMLDQLIALGINATNRFLPVKISKDSIVFRSPKFLNNDRCHIVMTPAKVDSTQWQAKIQKYLDNKNEFRKRFYENVNSSQPDNRRCVMQIVSKSNNSVEYETSLSLGEMIQSFYRSNTSIQDKYAEKFIANFDRVQYELFLRNEEPEKTVGEIDRSKYYSGFGSGYMATDNGLLFLPGFNYNGTVFTKFAKVDGAKEWRSESGAYIAKILFKER